MQQCIFVNGLKFFNHKFGKIHIIPVNIRTFNLKSSILRITPKHKFPSSPFVLTLIPFFNNKKPSCVSNNKIIVPVPRFCLCAPKVDERNEIYSVNFKFRNWFYSLGNFLKLFLRCGFILLLFFPFLLFYPLKIFSSYCDGIWWSLILRVIEISGPVLVKLGQWASTRRDLFPEKMCFNLSKLQHDRHPHPWRFTAKTLSKHFGDNWRDNFTTDLSGEPKPVGSGCVAQVYKMYANSDLLPALNGNNEKVLVPVALKVLHPNIQEQFLRDITIMRFLAKAAEFIFPCLKWISLQDCVSEFSDFMLSQIDLQHEGQMLEKFSNNFKNHSMVKFPQPIYPFVTSEVLLETWEEGIPIAKFIEEKVDPKIKEDMAVLLINILLKMAFVDNLVHSDLHPGNIFVQMVEDDGGEKKMKFIEDLCDMAVVSLKDYEQIKYKLVILDCGLTTELSSHNFDNFFTVFKSVILNRGDIVAQTFLNNSLNECPKPEEFSRDMELLVNKFRDKSLSLAEVDVGSLLASVFNILMYHKVKLESRFSSIMVAIMVLEGLGRSLDPSRDILEEAIPYLLG